MDAFIGELAAVGFLAMSSAVSEQKNGRRFLSGIALSVCLYKPTLLIWVVPLLIVARAWKTLCGFLTGAASLFCFTTAAFGGLAIWRSYLDMTAHLGRYKSLLPRVYIDAFSVLRLIMHSGDSEFLGGVGLCVGVIVMICAWYRVSKHSDTEHRLVLMWAITLPLALLINVYIPIYDSILLIVSLIVTAPFLIRIGRKRLIGGCVLLLLGSYCATWLATIWNIQILSFLIAGISAVQLLLIAPRHPSMLKAENPARALRCTAVGG